MNPAELELPHASDGAAQVSCDSAVQVPAKKTKAVQWRGRRRSKRVQTITPTTVTVATQTGGEEKDTDQHILVGHLSVGPEENKKSGSEEDQLSDSEEDQLSDSDDDQMSVSDDDQSNEVGGSYHMEQEGLRRSLANVENYVDVGTLVTDRHLGINKMVREDYPHITHFFDIWHVAKSVKKKLQNLAKLRDCQALKPWISSMINHLYWSVTTTPPGNEDVVVDKWRSVYQHTHDIHDGFQGHFPKCDHDPLEGREQRKPWLPLHTKVSVETEKIILNQRLCKDVKRLSPKHQTSYLEAFHALILHFAPKMYHFSYKGMHCRVILAALHFNENAPRTQAKRMRDGGDMYSLHYPKYKKGGYIVRKVLEKATFVYAKELMKRVEAMCCGEDYDGDMLEGLVVAAPVPPPLNATFEKPQKEAAVREHVARFNARDMAN
ncbi:uncharacterized protein [Branchiostoma lanceolatum]